MRRTSATFALTIISLIFMLIPNSVHGLDGKIKIKKIDSIKLAETDELNIIPRSFCKTEGDVFLIPHHEEGVIKVFQKISNSLIYVDKFGPGGSNSDSNTEFLNLSPSFCFYNSYYSKFGFLDGKEKKVYLFNQCRSDFLKERTISNVRGNAKLNETATAVVIADYTTDTKGKGYELYSVDVSGKPGENKKSYLLPVLDKYGYKDEEMFKKDYFIDGKIPAIGTKGIFDLQDNVVYFVWEGRLRVIKVNLISGKRAALIDYSSSSKEEKQIVAIPQYLEPQKSEYMNELTANYKKHKYDQVLKIKTSMSYIRDIFVTPDYIFVVFRGINGSKEYFRLLAFNTEGKLLGNEAIDGNFYQRMWFDKSNYKLYSLSQKGTNSEKKIIVYKIDIEAEPN